MGKGRLEAFSDGVIAIIITIMILELHVPRGAGFAALAPLVPPFVAYLLSFLFVGIYWNNHHHMLQVSERVSGAVLWANLHLLFWLSLVPATTAWMGETRFVAVPTALYGVVLLMAGFAYKLLQLALLRCHGPDFVLRRALGADRKGNWSLAAYVVAVPSCWINTWIAGAIYVLIALLWLLPDRRIEGALASD